MLEKEAPDAAVVLRCLLAGTYYYKTSGLPVAPIRNFVKLLKNSTEEQNKLVIANLHTRFDAIPRYSEPGPDDDVPF